MRNLNSHKISSGIRLLIAFVTAFYSFVNFSDIKAQGLINNGARIIISGSSNLIIDGGASTGNFTNQDFVASIGIVENSGTMSVSGNWTNNSIQNVFSANSGTVNLSGTTQTIGGTDSTYFYNLALTGSGTKTLAVNTRVGGGTAAGSGVLQLQASALDLNSRLLTVNNSASTAVTRTTGYVISETAAAYNPSIILWNCATSTGTYVFPFGSSHGYTPITITKSSTANSNISTSTRATVASNNLPWGNGVTHMYSPTVGGAGEIAVAIDRWYYVRASATINVNLQFAYAGIENTTTYNPTGTFGVQNWTGTWSTATGSGSGITSGTATVNAGTLMIGPSNNNWLLANTSAPLPLSLLAFDAACFGKDGVKITWSTASEINVDYFSIEKSENGQDFYSIGNVSSAGYSLTVNNYEFTDASPSKGLSYYRLVEHDVNATEVVFNPIMVKNCLENEIAEPQIYSSASTVFLNIASIETANCSISIFDVGGKLIQKNVQSLSQGLNSIELKLQLPKGIYIVQCSYFSKSFNKKIFID